MTAQTPELGTGEAVDTSWSYYTVELPAAGQKQQTLDHQKKQYGLTK